MNFLFFKKRNLGKLDDLEKARSLNLITEKEFLKLRLERAQTEFESFSEIKIKVAKKKK